MRYAFWRVPLAGAALGRPWRGPNADARSHCHQWGYKSDVWRRKLARGQARLPRRAPWPGGDAPPDGAHGGHVALHGASAGVLTAIGQLGRGVTPAALHAFAAAELRPLGASAAAWLRGGELRAAVAVAGAGAAALREADVQNHTQCAEACRALRGDCAHAVATLRAWRAELSRMAAAEAAQPAWAGLAALHDGCPVEACLVRVRRVLSITASVARTMHAASACPPASPAAAAVASSLDAAAARGLAAAYGCAQEWLARALAALAPARLAHVSCYLEVAAALGDEAAAFIGEWEAAARDRAAWMGAALAAANSANAAGVLANAAGGAHGGAGPLHAAAAQQDGAAEAARQLAQALEMAPRMPSGAMAAAVAAFCAARMQAPPGGAPP